MPYEVPSPELGWLLPRGGSRVRLAWQVPYWDRALEDPRQWKALSFVPNVSPDPMAKLFTDATTGERLLSDTIPMERYP